MFPERDFATEFWFFVREQAMDPLTNDVAIRPFCGELDEFECDRRYVRMKLADLLPADTDARSYPHQAPQVPWVYTTLQEALLGFLIYQVVKVEKFSYTFVNWLRTIILVQSDVQREPGWLHIKAVNNDEDPNVPPEGREFEHTMTVSNDWSYITSRETFDFILRRFSGRSVQ